MKITAVNIAEKTTVNYKGRIIETGIFKFPVLEPVFIDFEGIKNDAIIDKKYHGGVNQAIYGYSLEHYNYWKLLYPKLNFEFGMFGENLTISNLEETEITVGSTFKIGEVILEVTKPREPCMKLGLRFETQKVLKQFWNSTKCGIYFKVLKTGFVNVDDELILIEKSINTPTIAVAYQTKKSN
ncbi:MOSC domain-containing protein [Lutibacter sp.]|uniref:MOSC domain-containing protein n=1 Tax=Lutibacter sp. TaxID=1925666 RepID=UPI0027375258|nr:MOSC domain-containing protein [Lutibacter sp.]MDP3314281.1 MOSC domain-containing protein [Lutibacter sp.]